MNGNAHTYCAMQWYGEFHRESNISDHFDLQILIWKFRKTEALRWKFQEFFGTGNTSSQLTSSSIKAVHINSTDMKR